MDSYILSLVFYSFSIWVIFTFGAVYLFSNTFMPYHRDAIDMDWVHINRRVQTLILALMKIIGVASISVCILASYILMGLFQRHGGGSYILPSTLLGFSFVTLWVMSKVERETGAKPPVKIIIVSSLSCILGFYFSLDVVA